MDSPKNNVTSEHEIIVSHLRKSRDIGKHILKVVPETGSAIIEHKFKITTRISERIEVISEISFLPSIRMYKNTGFSIVGDKSLLNEDVEKC